MGISAALRVLLLAVSMVYLGGYSPAHAVAPPLPAVAKPAGTSGSAAQLMPPWETDVTTRTPVKDAAPSVGGPAPTPQGPVASAGAVGAAAAGQSSGSAASSIPIAVPPFHGQEPRVELAYDSATGDGWVGVGWNLIGTSFISRLSSGHGVAEFADTDIFQIDGRDLTRCTAAAGSNPECRFTASADTSRCAGDASQQRAYFTANDGGARIYCRSWQPGDANSEIWTVTDRDGTVRTFHPLYVGSRGVDRFVLQSIDDARGNRVDYDYGSQPSPATKLRSLREIRYNDVKVHFYSENRTDTVKLLTGGDPLSLQERLKSIAVTIASGANQGDQPVRAYTLQYGQSANNGRSVLSRVEEYGNDTRLDDSGNVVASPNSTAQPPPQSFTTDTSAETVPYSETRNSTVGYEVPPKPGVLPAQLPQSEETGRIPTGETLDTSAHDYHGHYRIGVTDASSGRTGAVLREDTTPCPSVYSIPNGSGPSYETVLKPPTIDGRTSCSALTERDDNESRWWLADADGDGAKDLVFLIAGPRHSNGHQQLAIAEYRNHGDGRFDDMPSISSTFDYTVDLFPSCAVGGLEGNGRDNVVCLLYQDVAELATFRFGQPVVTTKVADDPNPNFQRPVPSGFLLADFTGDGKSDALLYQSDDQADVIGFAVIRSASGDGTFQYPQYPFDTYRSPPDSNGWKHATLIAADINGDGRADVISVGHAHDNKGALTAVAAATTASNLEQFASTPMWIAEWLYNESIPPPGMPELKPEVSPAIFDGTANAGLAMIQVRAGHANPSHCAPAIPKEHLEELRLASNGDGTFTWPSSLDDCGRTQEIAADVPEKGLLDFLVSVAQSIADFFADTHQPADSRTLSAPLDVDGDGQSDVEVVSNATDPPIVTTAYSPPPARPFTGWAPLSLPGDGRTAFARLDTSNPKRPRVNIIQPRQGPTSGNCLKKPSLFCTPYTYVDEELSPPSVTVTDPFGHTGQMELPESVQSNWRRIDLDGHGRPTWVYVDSTTWHSFDDTFGSVPAMMVVAYLPRTDRSGWDSTPMVGWFKRAVDHVVGGWQVGNVSGDGRQGLLGVELGTDSMVVHGVTLDQGSQSAE